MDDSEPALNSLFVVTATNQTTGDVYTTTTDANGYYTFTGIVSGAYVVSIDAPAGYVSSSTDGGANAADLDDNGVGSSGGRITSEPFALTPGVTITDVQMVDNATGHTDNPSVDFGLWLPAALGNYVWLDTTTTDGLQNEAAINGVNGVTVTLFYSNPVSGLWVQGAVTTTTNHPITNDPGYYTFTQLISGTYYVSFTLPAGYSFTSQDAAGGSEATDSDADVVTGATAPVTLNAGDQNPDVDAGLIAPTLSLGNRVWYDVNNNGQIDSSESGLDGVRVELIATLTAMALTLALMPTSPIATRSTAGYYTFTNLSEGGYLVVISSTNFSGVLLNYRSSDPTTADPNDNVDSDDNGLWQANGVVASGVITLTLGNEPDGSPDIDGDSDADTNWTVDFGFYLVDLGDAPDSYSTTLSNSTPYTGASHVVSPTLSWVAASMPTRTANRLSPARRPPTTMSLSRRRLSVVRVMMKTASSLSMTWWLVRS
ncbi:MAG: SdrD B-like domain-containing protein [Caldilineaceae bacterium]